MDVAGIEKQFQIKQYPRVFVSALTGQGLEQLKKTMAESINEMQQDVELYFTKNEEYKIYDLGRDTRIVRKEAATEGTICYAQMSPALLTRWKDYLVK